MLLRAIRAPYQRLPKWQGGGRHNFRLGVYLPYSDPRSDVGVGEASVYISRSARHQGIGRLLLEALVRAGQQRGYHKLVGQLLASNQSSRLPCRALGSREVGVHEKYSQRGSRWADLVLVERLIPPNIKSAT